MSQISDENDHMLYANHAAEKLLGFSREDRDAALWDEGGHTTGDESGGGIGDSTSAVSGRSGHVNEAGILVDLESRL